MSRLSWSAAAVVGRTALQALSVWLCARWLGTDLMGQAALVWLAGTWVQVWGDGGMSHVIMAYRDLSREALVFLQRRQWVWCAGMAAAVVVVAFLFRQPYAWALALLAPAFIGQTAALLPQTLALRQNDMRTPALIEIAAEAAGLSALLIVIAHTADLWAIVARGWAMAFVVVVGYRSAIGPSLRSTSYVHAGAEPVRMGLQLTIERLLSILLSSLDRLIVSRFFGFDRLGLYEIALQWVSRPVGLVGGAYGRVALTDLTQTPGDLTPAFNTYIKRLSWSLFPTLALLAGIGPWLIPWLFGAAYRQSASLALWLTPFAAVRGLASATTLVWVALKRGDIRLIVSLLLIPVYIAIMWGGAMWGFEKFVVVFACVSTVLMLVLDYGLRYVYAGMPVLAHLKQWLPAAAVSCVLYVVVRLITLAFMRII